MIHHFMITLLAGHSVLVRWIFFEQHYQTCLFIKYQLHNVDHGPLAWLQPIH
uniref:Uncharacterized protein n=1 Tax=Octopus bimaculoides TaxID=37653 RepID=A0A0L8HFH0_OCTBM